MLLSGAGVGLLWGDRAWVSKSDPEEVRLAAVMAEVVLSSRADGTWTTYLPLWQKFVQWCAARTPPRTPLPADGPTVALYLISVAQTANTYSVVKAASGAICSFHDVALAGVAPTEHPMVALVRRSVQRRLGVALVNQKEPLDFEVIRGAASWVWTLEQGHNRWALALTLVLVGFCGFLRYSDLAQLYADEIHFYEDRAELFLETRKNDQLREGNVVVLARGESSACPVAALEWLLRSVPSLQAGGHVRLFQRFDGRVTRFHPERILGTMRGEEMSYDQMRSLMFALLTKCTGVPEEDLKRRYGTQSLRSGGATLVAAEGVSDRVFQRHGGWRTPQMKDHYVQDTMGAKLEVTRAMRY